MQSYPSQRKEGKSKNAINPNFRSSALPLTVHRSQFTVHSSPFTALMDHKDLDVWKKSIDFVLSIYALTDLFPKTELYGLSNQVRRAAVSVPSNIAEGAARNSNKEFIQFLYISLGSLSETETQIIIAKKLAYIKEETNILQDIQTLRKMLTGLIKYLKNK